MEIVDRHDTNTNRAVYAARFAEVICVRHAFQKKSRRGVAIPKKEIDLIQQRLAAANHDYRESKPQSAWKRAAAISSPLSGLPTRKVSEKLAVHERIGLPCTGYRT